MRIRGEYPHRDRRGEEFRQHDADGQVRDDQRDSDRRAQRKQCDRVKHGGRDGDDNRRNGVRKEDFQQFDVGGDQRDQVAFAFAGQFGGREATQRGKRFRPEQREQAEGDIVVHVLFGVAHAAADQCADNHGCDCRGKAEIPDFCASCGKQRGDAENRQERGGEVAEEGLVSAVFAAPKSAAGRRLVFPGGADALVSDPASERRVRLIFRDSQTTGIPLVARLAAEESIYCNVISASTQKLSREVYGSMLLGIPSAHFDRAVDFIKAYPNIQVEEVEHHVQ